MPASTRRELARWLLWAGGAGVVVALGLLLVRRSAIPAPARAAVSVKAPDTEAGRALFHGDVSVQARMVGHEMDLPPSVVRCANCHTREAAIAPVGTPSAGAGSGREMVGSPLSYDSLLRDHARRGGPPSRYTLPAFCRVLRDGVDPASVVIPQTMPRYSISDEECRDLWTYVITR